MYRISGVKVVATITELRSKTSELLDYVRKEKEGVLIQKNNAPYAVLLDWETFQKMTSSKPEADGRAKGQ